MNKNFETLYYQLTDELNVKNRILKEIASSLDTNKILERVINYLRELFYFEGFAVYLYDEEANVLKNVKYYTPETNKKISEHYESKTIPLSDKTSLRVKCFKKGEPLYFDDIEKMNTTSEKKKVFDMLGTKSLLLLPIRREKIKLGVIAIHSYKNKLGYTKDNIEKMFEIVQQIALLLDNSLTVKKLEHQTFNLDAAIRQLKRLGEISAKINSTLYMSEIIDEIIKGLVELFGFESVSLFLKSETADVLECVKFYNSDIDEKTTIELQNRTIPLSDEKLRVVKAFHSKKYIFLQDFKAIGNEKTAYIIIPKSILVVPLVVHDTAIGTISMSASTKNLNLSKQDIDMAITFAEQVAYAINNSNLYSKLNNREKEISRALGELEKLQKVTNLVNRTLDVDEVFNVIVEELQKLYDFEAFALLLVNEIHHTYKMRKFYTSLPLGNVLLESYDGEFLLDSGHGGRIADAIRENQIYYFDNVDIRTIDESVNRRIVEKLGLKSVLILPIEISGKVIGAINIINFTSSLNFTQNDINTIQRFTTQIAQALHNSRLYEEINDQKRLLEEKDKFITFELKMAEKVQQSILSSDYSNIEDVKILVKYEPMQMVGGDFYDITKLSNNHIRIFIADMTGHGIQASLMTMLLKAEYEKYKKSIIAPYELLRELNKSYIDNYSHLNVFFTAFILDIYLTRNKIIYSSSGHHELVLVNHKNNSIKLLKTSGRLIGAIPDADFQQNDIVYENGDKLVLFTDGMYEQFNNKNEIFGEERLYRYIKQNAKMPARELHNALYTELKEFIGDSEINDDLLLITIDLQNPEAQ